MRVMGLETITCCVEGCIAKATVQYISSYPNGLQYYHTVHKSVGSPEHQAMVVLTVTIENATTA